MILSSLFYKPFVHEHWVLVTSDLCKGAKYAGNDWLCISTDMHQALVNH